MKLKHFWAGLVLCTLIGCADQVQQSFTKNDKSSDSNAKKVVPQKKNSKPTAASQPLAVNATQASDMGKIVDGIVSANVSGPEELFKIISGETQTTDRELPLQATVREAAAQKLRIMCYEEGKDTVVASTDPTLLGKPVSDFRTSTDEVVRDKAIKEIRNSGKDRATFTYTEKPKADSPIVDGKGIAEGRVVAAAGRNAFDKFRSEKKFLCTVGAKIAVAG